MCFVLFLFGLRLVRVSCGMALCVFFKLLGFHSHVSPIAAFIWVLPLQLRRLRTGGWSATADSSRVTVVDPYRRGAVRRRRPTPFPGAPPRSIPKPPTPFPGRGIAVRIRPAPPFPALSLAPALAATAAVVPGFLLIRPLRALLVLRALGSLPQLFRTVFRYCW